MALSVTATLGVPGSASTWVFNVVRELRITQFSGERVHSFYQESVERVWQGLSDIQQFDLALVWKLHEPDETWAQFLAANRICLLLSIRDPRDAILSLMERFGSSQKDATLRVNATLQRISESVTYAPVLLRYEDRFFDQRSTVGAIAKYLGITITAAEQGRIFELYQTESIRRFAEAVETLPLSRLKALGATRYDEVTQIHRTHIGDQKIGKWRERFSAQDRRQLTRHFEPFLTDMGYSLD